MHFYMEINWSGKKGDSSRNIEVKTVIISFDSFSSCVGKWDVRLLCKTRFESYISLNIHTVRCYNGK